jgi:hypothetical protein
MGNALAHAVRSQPLPGISRKRKAIAAFVAGVSDLAQMAFFPAFVEGAASPFEIALDVATALVILLIVGFRWRLALALAAELVPGVDLFPTWTAVVLSLPTEPAPAPAAVPALPEQKPKPAPQLP